MATKRKTTKTKTTKTITGHEAAAAYNACDLIRDEYAEIDAHPLLDRDQKAMLKVMRNATREISMYDFARIALHATAGDFINADDDDIAERVKTERAFHYAALLYVYEALKACDHDIIKQWPEFDTMLQQLEDLNTLGLPS